MNHVQVRKKSAYKKFSRALQTDRRDVPEQRAGNPLHSTFSPAARSMSNSVILVPLYPLLGYVRASLILMDHRRMKYI